MTRLFKTYFFAKNLKTEIKKNIFIFFLSTEKVWDEKNTKKKYLKNPNRILFCVSRGSVIIDTSIGALFRATV